MFRTMTLALSLAIAVPAIAMDKDHHSSHHGENHQHGHDGAAANTDRSDEIRQALAAGGSLVEVSVLGMVCDFCATALNKTMGRREEVAAVNVDLDTKRMDVVLKQGETMDNETLTKLVESAGYKVKTIRLAGADSQAAPQ